MNRDRKDGTLQGSMTVFFCLSMLLVGAIICTCLESARTAGLRFMAKTASDSALQSVFADYHGQLWEDYHVFFHCEETDLADTVNDYLEYYENPAKDIYGGLDVSDILGLTVDNVSAAETKTAVSEGGRLFLEQAVEYEKYQVAEDILEMLLDRVGILDEIEKIRSFAVRLSESLELIQKISTLYQDVRDGVYQVRELGTQIKGIFDDGTVGLQEVYELLQELAGKASWLKQLAKDYLESAEEIGELAENLTEEYGASEDTVYGQQIQQLKAFAVDGLLGGTVSKVIGKADNLLIQLYSVMEEIEQFEEEYDAAGEENSDETGSDGEVESSEGTENETGTEGETEETWQERQAALYERVSEVISSGILFMQDLESAFDDADAESGSTGSDEKDGSTDGDDAGALLTQVKQWKNLAILSLVMGETAQQTRADYFFDTSSLPSKTADKTLADVTMAEKGLFVFYITDTFTSVLSASQENYAYQQEYILFGKSDSRSNLTAMAELLLAVREGINLAYALTDTQMRTLAESAAYALVGAAGLYPLVLITQFVILAAWAFAESVTDVRDLFKGDSVVLWKSTATWKTSISGLVNEEITEGILSDLRFSYEDYMRLFLLIKDTQTLCLRSMDIIQEEISSSESGFLMSDCYGAAQIIVNYSAPYRLITLPLVGASGTGHQIQVISDYHYQ